MRAEPVLRAAPGARRSRCSPGLQLSQSAQEAVIWRTQAATWQRPRPGGRRASSICCTQTRQAVMRPSMRCPRAHQAQRHHSNSSPTCGGGAQPAQTSPSGCKAPQPSSEPASARSAPQEARPRLRSLRCARCAAYASRAREAYDAVREGAVKGLPPLLGGREVRGTTECGQHAGHAPDRIPLVHAEQLCRDAGVAGPHLIRRGSCSPVPRGHMLQFSACM